MTLRRSPKLYARPRAGGCSRVQSTCSSKRRVSSPYSLRPPGCCKTCRLGTAGWTVCGRSVIFRSPRSLTLSHSFARVATPINWVSPWHSRHSRQQGSRPGGEGGGGAV